MVGFYFVILGETSEVAQPGEGALDHPAIGQDLKTVGMDFINDLGPQTAMTGQGGQPITELLGIGPVDEDHLQPAVKEQEGFQQHGAVPVLYPGAMHFDSQDQSQGVDQEVPLASSYVLA